jgi:hypothetical protein
MTGGVFYPAKPWKQVLCVYNVYMVSIEFMFAFGGLLPASCMLCDSRFCTCPKERETHFKIHVFFKTN